MMTWHDTKQTARFQPSSTIPQHLHVERFIPDIMRKRAGGINLIQCKNGGKYKNKNSISKVKKPAY